VHSPHCVPMAGSGASRHDRQRTGDKATSLYTASLAMAYLGRARIVVKNVQTIDDHA
jgi:hypothetical protein